MRFLTSIPLIIAWIPHVIKAVALFESVMDPTLSPQEKKEMVLSYLSTVSEKLNLPWGPGAIEVISDLIDTVVSVLKWFGQFRSKSELSTAEVQASSNAAALSTASAQANVKKVTEHDPALAEFLVKMKR